MGDDDYSDDEYEALTHDKLIGVDERRIPVHMRESFQPETPASPQAELQLQVANPNADIVPYSPPDADMAGALMPVEDFQDELPDVDYADQAAEKWEQEWEEAKEVTLDRKAIGMGGCVCLLWAIATALSLALFFWRYVSTIQSDLQRRLASSVLLEADAILVTALAPAASTIRSLALHARGGALGSSAELPMDRMNSVMRAANQQLLFSSHLTQVQLSDELDSFVFRPGKLRNSTQRGHFRKSHLQWQSPNCSQAANLPSCYGLDTSEFQPAADDGAAALLWSGPTLRRIGASGETLAGEQYDYRLTAVSEVATSDGIPLTGASELHILEARIDTRAVQDALRSLRRDRVIKEGIRIQLCRSDGLLLADSEEDVGLASVYDSPASPWAHSLDRSFLNSAAEQELWQADSFLVVRPLGVGFAASLSQLQRMFRVVAVVPRELTMNPWLERLSLSAAVLAGVFAVALVFGTFTTFCCCCCICCCRQRVKYVDDYEDF